MFRLRVTLTVSVLLVLAVWAALWMVSRRLRVPERVVLIVVDTLRRDYLSCYGGENRTPNIDALAQHGQVFTNVVASFHQTTMSMASLFTGRVPSISSGSADRSLAWTSRTWCGLARFGAGASGETCVPQGLQTLAERFRDAGYATAGVVSNLLLFRPYGYDQGFDEWVEVGGPGKLVNRSGLLVNQEVASWLGRRASDRFFLYVHYMDVHDRGLRSNDPDLERKRYARSVAVADEAIGGLMHLLSEAALLEDAVVVFTGDHGERLREVHAVEGPLGHWGNPSFEPVLRIPLIVSANTGIESDRLLRTDDVFRLVARVAGLDAHDPEDLAPGELFLTEIGYRTYRSGRWKSLWPRRDVVPIDRGLDAMLRPKSLEPTLFDIESDPLETSDLAATHPQVLERHRKRVDDLTRSLATTDARQNALTPLDRERLRSLGYLE